MVVRRICRREAPTTTRSEVLVVWTVVSCLGVGIAVGMIDRGNGSEIL